VHGIGAIVFEDGSTEVCDLLVGAAGAHSRVRPLVTDVLPEYTGVTWSSWASGTSTVRIPRSRK
jgi:2-polyprenyl-6-methoxyphenol hydroxylase-like FAD-dependent oxidoreductase